MKKLSIVGLLAALVISLTAQARAGWVEVDPDSSPDNSVITGDANVVLSAVRSPRARATASLTLDVDADHGTVRANDAPPTNVSTGTRNFGWNGTVGGATQIYSDWYGDGTFFRAVFNNPVKGVKLDVIPSDPSDSILVYVFNSSYGGPYEPPDPWAGGGWEVVPPNGETLGYWPDHEIFIDKPFGTFELNRPNATIKAVLITGGFQGSIPMMGGEIDTVYLDHLQYWTDDPVIVDVPEPASLMLLMAGLGVVWFRRK